ncbi:MAG: tetratricopeptide repeat protein [bacterium]
MPRRWVKEELKKDRLASWVERSVTWVNENKENAIIGAIVILAVVIFIPFSLSRRAKMNEQAFSLLARGQQEYFNNQPDKAISFYDQALRHSGSKATPLVLLYKGNTLYEMEKYSEAASAYRRYLDKYETRKFTPEVLMSLANSLEQEEKFNEAKEIYQRFLDGFPEHYLLPGIYQGLGRCYEKLGQKDEAIKIYQQMSHFYSGSIWQDMAEAKIKALSPTP